MSQDPDASSGRTSSPAPREYSGGRPTAHATGSPGGYAGRPEPSSLADILERVLDKGIVIAGDIQVNLLDIELLTIKIRLLVVSVDKAAEMGIDWWRSDPMLNSEARERQQLEDGHRELEEENRELRERLDRLERRLEEAE